LSLYSKLILALITLWGVRLSFRIYSKNKGKPEDFRYSSWRKEWSRKGNVYYLARAYLQIFILQGFIVSLVLLPFTLSLGSTELKQSMILIPLLLWIIGFVFEAVGDRQLDLFIKDPNPHKGTIMKTGLWKYTRHPNYFGESMMWWGLAGIAYVASGSIFVFISPIIITYLLLYVSGIPMLEKKWDGIPEWEVYKKKTSAFFPLPPKN
jgi:steroid 5-alpha reductase family enzyme